MAYRVRGLDPEAFDPLFELSEAELAARGIERVIVDAKPNAPCRVSLDDVDIGEPVLLLNYLHQPAASPYHQQGPIFVSRAPRAFDANEFGPALRRRTLSLRGFDAAGAMIDADLAEGAEADAVIARFFDNPAIAYIHAHYARRGCFAATIDRA